MITAEELIDDIFISGSGAGGDSYNKGDIERIMIEFAKLHVEAALKEASENAEMNLIKYTDDYEIDRYSILNAYPLENIK